MAKKRETTASEDGVALIKAMGLMVLAVALIAGGSLAAAFGGHWILGVPFWAAGGVAIWKARGPLVRESRLYEKESAHPVAVLDTESERDRCPCCRHPTIEEGDDTCLLCDWPIDVGSDTEHPVPLSEARENFGRFTSIYNPKDAPEWLKLSADEVAVKRRLIAAYKRIGRGKRSAWFKARSLEEDLAVRRHRSVACEQLWPELPPTE